jgi:hypothetical protein
VAVVAVLEDLLKVDLTAQVAVAVAVAVLLVLAQ